MSAGKFTKALDQLADQITREDAHNERVRNAPMTAESPIGTSPTPEVDELLGWVKLPEDLATHAANLEVLARKLERERDEARHQVAAWNAKAIVNLERAERAEAALAEAHQTIRECVEGMASEYMGCPACGMGHLPDQDYSPHQPECGLLPFLPGATVLTPPDAPSPSPTPAVE